MPDDLYTSQDTRPASLLAYYRRRVAEMVRERSSWVEHWREMAEYTLPRNWRYLLTDRNKGVKRNDKIINNTPTRASRIFASGFHTGMTSQARVWFRLLPDATLIDDYDVRNWLDRVEKIMREEMAKSNIYSVFHQHFAALGCFGTSVIYIEETDSVAEGFRAYLVPVGQFCLDTSEEGRPDVLVRQFSRTARQLVRDFGYENCSKSVQNAYDAKNYSQWFQITWVVEPRADHNPFRSTSDAFPWASVWFEDAASDASSDQKFLRISGYHEQPFMAGRWEAVGEDIYGSNNPGMDCLGDCKALQLWERRKAQAIDKVVDPAVQVPASLRHQRIGLLPGDQVPVPESAGQNKIVPIHQVDPQAVSEARQAVLEHEQRIKQTWFYDLFLLMQTKDDAPNGGKQPITAAEVSERHDEKMLQLGPVVELEADDVFDPVLNRILHILARNGKLPPAPPQLANAKLRVEYVSIMAQAQKLMGTSAVERFASFVGSLSALDRDMLDNVDFDELIRQFSDMLGIPIKMLKSPRMMQQLRAARQQAAQQQQAMQDMQGAAQAAQAASKAEIAPDNLLGTLLNSAGGGGGAI